MGEMKLVLPGEQVATMEEYEPGDGTYESEGKVYAGWVGVLQLDDANKVVRVRPFNPPAELREGDIVYVGIENIRPAMAAGNILGIHGRGREMAGVIEGSLHISKIASGYTEDFHGMLHLGDVIRARVDQAAPSVQISTQDRNLGVVRALCGNCRRAMARLSEGEVKCPNCEAVERRKLAADYGELVLEGMIHVEPPQAREPRMDRDDRGDRGDRGPPRGPPRDRDRGGDRRGGRGGGRDRDRGRGGGRGGGGYRGGGRGGGGGGRDLRR